MHQPEVDVPEVIDGKGWFIETKTIKDPLTVAKEMDRFNYRLLQSKVQALGGVPVSCKSIVVPIHFSYYVYGQY